MSTDTPVQKDEPNVSAEQQPAPVQPASAEQAAPMTETAATDMDVQPSSSPETEAATPPPAEPDPAALSPRSGRKRSLRAQRRQGIRTARPESPGANSQLRFPLFQRVRFRRPPDPDSFLAYSIHAHAYGPGAARAAQPGRRPVRGGRVRPSRPRTVPCLSLVLERLEPYPRPRQSVFGGIYPRRATDSRVGARSAVIRCSSCPSPPLCPRSS